MLIKEIGCALPVITTDEPNYNAETIIETKVKDSSQHTKIRADSIIKM